MFDCTSVINASLDFFDEFRQEVSGDHGRSFNIVKILFALNNNTLVEEMGDIEGSVLFLLEVFFKLLHNSSHSNVLDEETDFRVRNSGVELIPDLIEVFCIFSAFLNK